MTSVIKYDGFFLIIIFVFHPIQMSMNAPLETITVLLTLFAMTPWAHLIAHVGQDSQAMVEHAKVRWISLFLFLDVIKLMSVT